ncbi:MAG: winged helix-turn-helix domain-containing protein [Acetobacteraceae bacterium]
METSDTAPALGHRIEFGPFTLLPGQRLLLRDGQAVRLGTRAFDVLLALAARPGELVTKEELISQVWPTTYVDEANLRVQLVALRKALGEGGSRLISNDPGRGYRFTPKVTYSAMAEPVAPAASSGQISRRLPVAMTRLIGRAAFIDRLTVELPNQRLITIVGPGGIGKTRVAVACAEALADSYADGVAFVDLTEARDLHSVTAELAGVLEIAPGTGDSLRDAIGYLRQRDVLLVIDNCEHVVDAAAELVEAILAGAPRTHILATSREALRASGEWVRSLPPLASPPADVKDLSAAAALQYPAVELFIERATAARFGYRLSDAEAPLVGEICRRLDGVALAIELAAAQVDVLGVAWLAAHLDERLWVLNRGRRTAVPRHQTLTAMLDWSYELLSEQERTTLHCVAAFPGDFSLAEAVDMATSDGIKDIEVIGAVGGLVSKSLAMLDVSGSVTRYRLPAMTRAYASAKLRSAQARSSLQDA